ncbi:conserved hypothetical protein [Mesorhizobium delmotii]|uniref:Uncharacterized protein n=1 Tax=Mesorhizobium delmotii TaxID=1631247 RepID=A0A2P9AIQ6_9HYPH|nr:conserved hypothetical protein [Mesorhizobium delmotii]
MAEWAEAAATTAELAGHMHENALGMLAEMMMSVHCLLLELYLTIYLNYADDAVESRYILRCI